MKKFNKAIYVDQEDPKFLKNENTTIMKLNRYNSVSDASKALKERGYTDEFKLEGNGKMRNLSNGNTYGTQDLKIVEYHRFEGKSNPSDMSIVFAVEATDNNSKGIVISSYGPYADLKLVEFMDKVKVKDRSREEDGSS
ncbi:MAG: hypothetical protein R3350_03610 [Saprospiraceae bacterium]|nr:hypothetical protein [Saprospiraceae bacterium]